MTPYEALYGRKCRMPICWEEISNRKLLAPEKVQETTEKIQLTKKKVKDCSESSKELS